MQYSQKLVDHFIREEGYELKAYKDHQGHWTIGIGHKLPAGKDWVGYTITKEQAYQTLYRDLNWAFDAAEEIFPEYNSFPENVRVGLVDMIFNMGESRFRGFKKTINLINQKKFKEASEEALDSEWAKLDVPNRAKHIAQLLRG